MNLFFRLLWLSLFGRFRSRVAPLGPCVTPFRVMPSDLDVLRHVNNGVYLSILDLARVDLMQRCGVAHQLQTLGWYPVVVAETIAFRRSLTLFQRFSVETVVLGWDERAFIMQHRFLRDGEEVATAAIRARFLKRGGGSVTPAELLALAGVTQESPELPGWVGRWNADQIALRATQANTPARASES